MTGISEADVRRIARLARLRLSDEEVRLYQDQLGHIFEHMRELAGLDTSAVSPVTDVSGAAAAHRPDAPHPFEDRQALLSNAPSVEGPYFKVPKIIE